jgi:hypothetical protein
MKIVRTIAAVILAFLVLVSSTNFVIGVHYCMGKVKDVAFLTKADACKNETKLPPCHKQTKPCCEDETILHKGDDLKAPVNQLDFTLPVAIEMEQPLVLLAEIIPSSPVAHREHYLYDPPLRSYDITLAHHVFLI